MARDASVLLSESFVSFIDEQVRAGRYAAAGEVVMAGLRLLEERDSRAKALEAALIAGEASGLPEPFDNAAFVQAMRTKYAR